MITAKRVLLSGALILSGIVLAAAAAYLFVSDEMLVAWIAKQAESATGVSIGYQAPVKLSRTLSPTLTVTDLVVTDTQSGYRLRTSSVEIQVSLPRLLLGQLDIPRLWLGNTRIESSGAAAPAPAASAADKAVTLPLKPAFQDVKIAQLSIVRTEGEMRLPALDVNELSLSIEPDTSVLVLHGRLHLAGEPSISRRGCQTFGKALRPKRSAFRFQRAALSPACQQPGMWISLNRKSCSMAACRRRQRI